MDTDDEPDEYRSTVETSTDVIDFHRRGWVLSASIPPNPDSFELEILTSVWFPYPDLLPDSCSPIPAPRSPTPDP